jgi:ribulose-5-phosphate 4-epimerase/fuculose-1-phosphate aldolase
VPVSERLKTFDSIGPLLDKDYSTAQLAEGSPEDKEKIMEMLSEIGTGPTGIVNTVPGAFERNEAVIVHGHGVFCSGSTDFNKPLNKMIEIERCCKSEYFNLVSVLL